MVSSVLQATCSDLQAFDYQYSLCMPRPHASYLMCSTWLANICNLLLSLTQEVRQAQIGALVKLNSAARDQLQKQRTEVSLLSQLVLLARGYAGTIIPMHIDVAFSERDHQ